VRGRTECSTGNAPISTTRDTSDGPDRTEDGAIENLLRDAFADLNETPGPSVLARLGRLSSLLEEWGSSMNLSGHRTREQIIRRLILDAVALWYELQRLPAVRASRARNPAIVDLGSGAGFPGIPFAVLAPEVPVLLVDSRERRHHFQRAARRLLELTNLDADLGRIEELPVRPSGVVIAQALAAPAQVLEWGLRWADAGAVLVIPGSEEAPDPGPHPALTASGTCHYRVPLGGPHRSLWWGQIGPVSLGS